MLSRLMTAQANHAAVTAGEEEVQSFFAAIDEFARAVRRARGAQRRSAEGTLSLSQYALLEALSARRTARVAELADEAGVTASTATRILDTLQRRGIVRRQRSRDDRRGVAVTLTDSGRELLQAQERWVSDRRRAFLATLPPAQREVVPELLVGLAALIDELAAGSSG